MRKKPLFAFALSVATAVLAHGGAATAAGLDVCIDSSSPSARVDERVARAVARQQGDAVRVHYYNGTGDEDGYHLRAFKDLLADECDLVVGFPYAADGGELPRGIRATQAYASTAFVLVTLRSATLKSIADMPDATPVAVTFNTAPNVYYRAHPNLVRKIYETDAESLGAVAKRDVAAAMLWQPAAVQAIEHGHFPAFDFGPLSDADTQFRMVALYADRGAAAASKFDASIAALRGNGALAKALGRYASASASARSSDASPRRAFASAHRSVRAACAATPKAKAPPALFTDAQAAQGAALYQINCAFCHAPDLNGRAGPALKGKFFAPSDHGHSVGDIFTIVSENMPATQPGSLKHDEYVRIYSYILQQNGYPAGSTELDYDTAKKSKTPLRYYGP